MSTNAEKSVGYSQGEPGRKVWNLKKGPPMSNIRVYSSHPITTLDGRDRERLAIDAPSITPNTRNNSSATLRKYLGYLKYAENKSEKTIDNRRYILEPFIKRIDKQNVQDIRLTDVDEFLMQRGQEIKPSSLNAEKQAIRSFFSYCQAHLLLEMSFDFRVIRRQKERPPRVVPLTEERVAEVVSDCRNYQLQLIITTLFETGMRIGELLNLCWEDINGTQIQVRGKGSKDRVVFLPYDLAVALNQYSRKQGIYRGHVFRPEQVHVNHPSDRYVSAYAVRDRIEREFKRHGVKMHPHQLRHSFAVRWIQKGGDIRTLQVILGHDSLETTQRYLGFSNNYMNEVYQRTIPGSIISLQR